MENYEILSKLGKGAQGSVFLVRDKRDKGEFVMKMVECNDELDASRAIKEAMALRMLEHRNICGYKEFFKTWDKKTEAIHVCIVLSLYKDGDLAKAMEQRRLKKLPLTEKEIKSWFGQLVDGMVYVHNKKFIHRDLKPSNIFMSGDTLIIGDFGVATIMEDTRVKTRTSVGTLNWMAPEVLDRPYDERSDVWSLGCILLQMSTINVLDQGEDSETLMEIKHSPQRLEVVLEEVKKHYGAGLCHVLRQMLRRSFRQRPTMSDLLRLPWVQACLKACNSSLFKATLQSNSSPGIPPHLPPVPKSKGCLCVLESCRKHADVGAYVAESFKALAELTAHKVEYAFTEEDKLSVAQMMLKHLEDSAVQANACKLMKNLMSTTSDDDPLFTSPMIEPILLAMRTHAASVDLQREATSLVWALSTNEDAARVLGEKGAVQDVLGALREHAGQSEICQACCGALFSLAVNEENGKIIQEEKGVNDIIGAMSTHGDHDGLLECACSALWSLSVDDEVVETISDMSGVMIILKAIEVHKKSPKLAKQAFILLASLIVDDHCAYSLVENDDHLDGLGIILATVTAHLDQPDVAENACLLLGEMAEHSDLIEAMTKHNAKGVLAQIAQTHAKNAQVANTAKSAIRTLAEKGAQ
eukprot:Opistho-2@62412